MDAYRRAGGAQRWLLQPQPLNPWLPLRSRQPLLMRPPYSLSQVLSFHKPDPPAYLRKDHPLKLWTSSERLIERFAAIRLCTPNVVFAH